MSPITTDLDWCEIDQLDGVELTDGERIRLRWPDGREEKVTIVVERDDRMVSDMWGVNPSQVRKAFVPVTLHGARVRVRLGAAAGGVATAPQFHAERLPARKKKAPA